MLAPLRHVRYGQLFVRKGDVAFPFSLDVTVRFEFNTMTDEHHTVLLSTPLVAGMTFHEIRDLGQRACTIYVLRRASDPVGYPAHEFTYITSKADARRYRLDTLAAA